MLVSKDQRSKNNAKQASNNMSSELQRRMLASVSHGMRDRGKLSQWTSFGYNVLVNVSTNVLQVTLRECSCKDICSNNVLKICFYLYVINRNVFFLKNFSCMFICCCFLMLTLPVSERSVPRTLL